MYNTTVRSMKYRTENCVINKNTKEKINATEMGFWKSCRLTRMDRITNEEIRRRMGAENTIKYIEKADVVWTCQYQSKVPIYIFNIRGLNKENSYLGEIFCELVLI